MPNHLCDLDTADRVLECLPVIQAEYVGPWAFPEQGRVIEMWTLLQDIEGYPIHSTVSETTIRQAGFAVPERAR